MRILLVDDDEHLAELLRTTLTEQHYVVDTAADGQAGWALAESLTYDLILLDVMLPKLDGIRFCRQLRAQGKQVPVLLLTARDTSNDKVMGLDAGADDYVVKPIDLQELTARMRALLRRGTVVVSSVLEWGKLRLDPGSCEVTYDRAPLRLTPKEYALLELFLRNNQRVYSRSAILDQLWSLDDDPPGEDTVKTHIKGLRQRLKAVGAADLVETVYGLGYRLNQSYAQTQAQTQAQSLTPALAATESQRQQQIQAAVAKIWQRAQGKALDRITVLEQAAQALQANQLDNTLHEQARQEAHKLAGSLGTFGADEGSQLARQIETLLHAKEALKKAQSTDLLALITRLRASVDSVSQPSEPSSEPTVAALTTTATTHPPSKPCQVTEASILAIDDDPLILTVLQTVLEPWGFQVTPLDDPQHFWEMLPTVAPDLVILDIEMPRIDGIKLCSTLRDDTRWGWLPVLFLTAKTDAATLHQIFEAGADDYIGKPIVAPELVARICNRLKRTRRLRHEGSSP
ncbi:MAG: response regulator [Stenomitos frigidus ULC029]